MWGQPPSAVHRAKLDGFAVITPNLSHRLQPQPLTCAPSPFYHFLGTPMNLTTREVSHVTIVDLNGRITLGDETGRLRDTVHELIASGKKKIILNLSHIDYIDSTGVGELVSGFTAVRNAGGELKLFGLSKKVRDILNVTKLYTVFDIKDDEFTAVKSFDYFFAK
jgi:anti-sigma B factor antagonist